MYYRVYTENGEIPARHPLNSDDPSLTRIKALSVAPPHTVASIKRCLCAAERIGDFKGSKIFYDLTSESPMEAGAVPIMTIDGPGSSPETPMVLVRPPLDQVIKARYSWNTGTTGNTGDSLFVYYNQIHAYSCRYR